MIEGKDLKQEKTFSLNGKWCFICPEYSRGARFCEMLAMKYYNGEFSEYNQMKSPFGLVNFYLGDQSLLTAKELIAEFENNNIVKKGQFTTDVLISNPILFPAPNNEPIEHVIDWFLKEQGGSKKLIFKH